MKFLCNILIKFDVKVLLTEKKIKEELGRMKGRTVCTFLLTVS